MQQFRLLARLMLLGLLVTFHFQCKKHAATQTLKATKHLSKADLRQVQKWFAQNWGETSVLTQGGRMDESSDTIPWDFVDDRIRHISPQWAMGRGFPYNGFTLYEIPVTLEDDMLFKLMPVDPARQMDSLSEHNPSSVSYLVVKEAEQEYHGEVMTILPTYEFVEAHGYDSRAIPLSLANIYQSETLNSDFSGKILFHDQSGRLLRQLTYQRGSLVNINRYDQADPISIMPYTIYRAPAPCETVTVVWRECNSVIVDNVVISEQCTPWIPIGSYNVGDCGSGSGTSGGAGSFDPAGFTSADDGPLSCKSFNFKKVTSTWQEAGVSGLQLVGDWFGTYGGFSLKKFGDIYVGIPAQKQNGQIISPGEAAEAAADAANSAAKVLQLRYFGMPRNQFDPIPASSIAADFRLLMESTLKARFGADCKVTKMPSGAKTTLKAAVWINGLFGGGGSCN
jgi:hypothetical protein